MSFRSLRSLGGPLLLYLLLATAYMLVIPAGESPDEPGHLQCVEQVALLGQVPVREPAPVGMWWESGVTQSGRMCYHMPLYYGVAGLVLRVVASTTGTAVDYAFPPDNPEYTTAPLVPLLQHSAETPLNNPLPPTLLALRLLSILLGAIVLICTYVLARIYFPSLPQAATFATLLLAAWPQYVFLYRGISNDVLATTLAIGTLLVLARNRRPHSYLVAALFGILATLAKLTSWFSLLALTLLFLVDFVRDESRRPDYFITGMLGAIMGLVTATAVWLHPTVGGHLRFSLRAFGRTLPEATTLDYWQQVAELTLSSGYLRFGWMDIAAPQWQAVLWWSMLTLLAAVGLFRFFAGDADKKLQLGLLLLFWLCGLLVSYYRINVNRFQPQFRFMLASAPLIVVMAGAGLGWLGEKFGRNSHYIPIAIAFSLFSLNIWHIVTFIIPIYYS